MSAVYQLRENNILALFQEPYNFTNFRKSETEDPQLIVYGLKENGRTDLIRADKPLRPQSQAAQGRGGSVISKSRAEFVRASSSRRQCSLLDAVLASAEM